MTLYVQMEGRNETPEKLDISTMLIKKFVQLSDSNLRAGRIMVQESDYGLLGFALASRLRFAMFVA